MERTTSKNSLFSICSDAPCSEIFFKGDRCQLDENRVGTVAFVGRTSFAPGDWIGLVLDKPEGKNNGTVNNVRYFECGEKFGIFCRPFKLKKLFEENFTLSPVLKNNNSPVFSIPNSIASTSVATRKLRSIYAVECGYDIGDRVKVFNGKNGVVKFLGKINNELYAGIQLDRPLGLCDGTFNNIRYFKCNPLYGIFVLANRVKKCSGIIKPTQIQVRHTKTSTMRTTLKGSHESLNSIGLESNSSTAFFSPKFAKASGKLLVKDNEIVSSLKKCLQEKEAHLEHLSKELDQQRTEMARIVNKNLITTENFDKIKLHLEEEQKTRRNIELERDELKNNIDDLMFRLDEKELINANLEADLAKLKLNYDEIQKTLNLSVIANQFSTTFQNVENSQNEIKNLETNNFQFKSEKNLVNQNSTQNLNLESKIGDKEFFLDKDEKKLENITQKKLKKTNEVEVFVNLKNASTQTKSKTLIDTTMQTKIDTVEKESNTNKQTNLLNLNLKSVETQCMLNISETKNFQMQTNQLMFNTNIKVIEKKINQKNKFSQTELNKFNNSVMEIASNSINSLIHKNKKLSYSQNELHNILNLPSKKFTRNKSFEYKNNSFFQEKLNCFHNYDSNFQNFFQDVNAKVLKTNKEEINKKKNFKINNQVCQTSSIEKIEKAIQNSISKFENLQIQKTKNIFTEQSTQTDPILFENNKDQNLSLSNNFIKIDSDQKNTKNSSTVQELSILSLLQNNALIDHQKQFQLKEKNEKIEAESTITFLNSIIYEQNCTINKLHTELMEQQNINLNNANSNIFNESKNKKTNSKVLRVYCDYCEVFDFHETKNCLKEIERLAEAKNHTKIVSPNAKFINQLISSRSYCNICEAFVHETNDCPNKTLSP